MGEHVVGAASELPEGDRILVELDGRQIGVFNVGGEYYAYANWCVHQGGPLCEGGLTGTQEASYDRDELRLETKWHRDGEIVMCPWHGWKYDLKSGACLSRRGGKLREYPIRVEDDQVIVTI